MSVKNTAVVSAEPGAFNVKSTSFSLKSAGFSAQGAGHLVKGTGFSPYVQLAHRTWALAPEGNALCVRLHAEPAQ